MNIKIDNTIRKVVRTQTHNEPSGRYIDVFVGSGKNDGLANVAIACHRLPAWWYMDKNPPKMKTSGHEYSKNI